MPLVAAYTNNRTKHDVRVRRFLLAAGAYGACLPLLAIAHVLGLIPLKTVVEVGGLMIGVTEAFAQGYVGGQWSDIVVFAVLIAFMLFRPTGLFGTRAIQKV